jgi:hypothetical protein
MRRERGLKVDANLLPKHRKPIPHAFVLDAIATLSPYTRPMFGCLAIYVNDKIVLILRDKPTNTADNGVWLATTQGHHQSLRREFPNMRSIQVLGKQVTGWQVLPVDAPDFESATLRACELVLAGDPRIGKIPGARTSKSETKAAGRSPKQVKTPKKHGSTIDFDAVRKIGLALPGVEASTAYGSPALKIRGNLTLGIFLLLAVRDPAANRSLIAFGGWAKYRACRSNGSAGIPECDRAPRTRGSGCVRNRRCCAGRTGSGKEISGASLCCDGVGRQLTTKTP